MQFSGKSVVNQCRSSIKPATFCPKYVNEVEIVEQYGYSYMSVVYCIVIVSILQL